jgi:ABC-type xylose transport system permease subunit
MIFGFVQTHTWRCQARICMGNNLTHNHLILFYIGFYSHKQLEACLDILFLCMFIFQIILLMSEYAGIMDDLVWLLFLLAVLNYLHKQKGMHILSCGVDTRETLKGSCLVTGIMERLFVKDQHGQLTNIFSRSVH